MHLKIPTSNLTAARQPPGRMAADKAKGTPLQETATLSNKAALTTTQHSHNLLRISKNTL